jgi:hypothetical protein
MLLYLNRCVFLAIKTVKTELNGSLKVMSENELSDLVSQTSDDIFVPTEKILPQGNISWKLFLKLKNLN